MERAGVAYERRRGTERLLLVVREGMRVGSTGENAVFIMLASFVTTFGVARGITHTIRSRGGFGHVQSVAEIGGDYYDYLPTPAGGVAIASRGQSLDRWLAIPFGAGVALVLDEAALLLELEDVYWADEGVLSIEVAYGAIALFALLAYLVRLLRRGESSAREADWLTAASAWDQLVSQPGGGGLVGR